MADTTGKDQLFGETLPGTGGDFIDTTDVEGHMANKRITPMPPSARITDNEDVEDVEGHRRYGGYLEADGGSEGVAGGRGTRLPSVDGAEDDVEGHIYTGGPSTQGEFAKRGPGENPHGDRLR